MLATATKYCPACQQDKPVGDFDNCSSKADGKRYRCKQCDLEHRPAVINSKYAARKPNGKLRPWKVQTFERVRLEYRTADKLPTDIMPPGWYKVIDKGYGIPATDVEVHLWHEILALRARVKQLEALA